MIILLHGEDSYRSRQKLNQIVEIFKQKDPSGMNLIFLDGSNLEFSQFKQNYLASPFMGDKRLIVIENILSQRKESIKDEIFELIKKSKPASSVLVFWEEQDFDKRKKLAKHITKNSQAEEFKNLVGIELNNWIKSQVSEKQGKISNQAVDKIASYVGPNLRLINNEIEKLILFKEQGQEINEDDVDLMVKAKLDTNIFNFIDAIGSKEKSKALKLLHDQLESGENIQYLLSMINYQFRNLLLVKELLETGYNQYNLGKEIKMHPYVIKKTVQQCSKYELVYLKMIYQKILDLDSAIKAGNIQPVLGLDMLVVALCS
jgi:DNA polymerase-3 subunit delta